MAHSPHPLVPAKAGTQSFGQELDARFRGHEREGAASYEDPRASIASAIATVRRAISACMRSTMRPSICTTPLFLFAGRSNAAIIWRACATSSSDGENAALQGSIWLGW